MGRSTGGLFAQMLAGRGLSAATGLLKGAPIRTRQGPSENPIFALLRSAGEQHLRPPVSKNAFEELPQFASSDGSMRDCLGIRPTDRLPRPATKNGKLDLLWGQELPRNAAPDVRSSCSSSP
jgi:hypothetical protein